LRLAIKQQYEKNKSIRHFGAQDSHCRQNQTFAATIHLPDFLEQNATR